MADDFKSDWDAIRSKTRVQRKRKKKAVRKQPPPSVVFQSVGPPLSGAVQQAGHFVAGSLTLEDHPLPRATDLPLVSEYPAVSEYWGRLMIKEKCLPIPGAPITVNTLVNRLGLKFSVTFATPPVPSAEPIAWDHLGVYRRGNLWLHIPLKSKGIGVFQASHKTNHNLILNCATVDVDMTLNVFRRPWYSRLWAAILNVFIEKIPDNRDMAEESRYPIA